MRSFLLRNTPICVRVNGSSVTFGALVFMHVVLLAAVAATVVIPTPPLPYPPPLLATVAPFALKELSNCCNLDSVRRSCCCCCWDPLVALDLRIATPLLLIPVAELRWAVPVAAVPTEPAVATPAAAALAAVPPAKPLVVAVGEAAACSRVGKQYCTKQGDGAATASVALASSTPSSPSLLAPPTSLGPPPPPPCSSAASPAAATASAAALFILLVF
mmetsp:Transcript_18639/g.31258  ORF Transcript_18639/g.31258 Transcript_18639/m.31258 type:complete len:217 (+) Transcript_18639:145-795(+)